MIKPTDEMIVAFEEASGDVGITTGNTRSGLAAVLAIVERDHLVLCGAGGPDGVRCERQPHHPGELHGYIGIGELVRW